MIRNYFDVLPQNKNTLSQGLFLSFNSVFTVREIQINYYFDHLSFLFIKYIPFDEDLQQNLELIIQKDIVFANPIKTYIFLE